MLFASCRRMPVAPVFDWRYEPAKSTILNRDLIDLPFPVSVYVIVKTA